jgi:hypothetical protein
VTAPRGKPYDDSPWCLDPQDSPYGLGLALTQEEIQQSLRLIQNNSLTVSTMEKLYDATMAQVRYVSHNFSITKSTWQVKQLC